MSTRHAKSRLPEGWYRDEDYKERIHEHIKSMNRYGRTYMEIADIVGCTDKTVQRVLHPVPGPTFHKCNARLFRLVGGIKQRRGLQLRCVKPVNDKLGPKAKCYVHRQEEMS